jgi:hypothetical protein
MRNKNGNTSALVWILSMVLPFSMNGRDASTNLKDQGTD